MAYGSKKAIGGLLPFSLNKMAEDSSGWKDSDSSPWFGGRHWISLVDLSLQSSSKICLWLSKQIDPLTTLRFTLQLQPSVELISTGAIWEQLPRS